VAFRSSNRPVLIALAIAGILACAPAAAFALDPARQLRDYRLRIWQTENGLPQNTVHDILQTRDGYIWLATDSGVARFDGLQFRIFDRQNTNEIRHGSIRRLFEDRAGNLWLATAAGLVRYAHGKFTLFTRRDGLSSESVWSISQDSSGTLWIATSLGLDRYLDGRFTSADAPGLKGESVVSVIEARAGGLWIATTGSLARFNGSSFTSYEQKDGLPADELTAICEDQQGWLWIGTSHGLRLLANNRLTNPGSLTDRVETLHADKSGNVWIGTSSGLWKTRDGKLVAAGNGLPANEVTSILEDRAGVLWFATPGGIARWKDEKFEALTPADGLSSSIVLSLFEDREGNLWIGTESGGVNLLRDTKFVTITRREGLSSDLVRSIYEDRDSSVWMGTFGGGLNHLRQGRVTTYTTRDGLPSNTISSVLGDRQGNIWVGTPAGLSRLTRGTFKTFTSANGISDDGIRSLHEDPGGNLWIGTRRGLTSLNRGRYTTYTALDGLANDFVGAICDSRDGGIWIGTLGGLSLFRNGQFKNFTVRDGMTSDVVTTVHEDAQGALWAGTLGGGLNRLRDGLRGWRITGYTTRDGLVDDVVYDVMEDDKNNLWLSTTRGIVRISKQEIDRFDSKKGSLQSVTYGTSDGLATREGSGGGHPAGCRSDDGKLWFSTVKGAAVIDPNRIEINEHAPPVVIEEVLVDDRPTDNQARLEPGTRRVEFHYAGLSFTAPEEVAYRYRLEGFDRDWRGGGTQRIASYTNIPAGYYTFRVVARNSDGVWNEAGESFDFSIKPHFYRTYWFYALMAAMLGVAVWGWYRQRVRRVEDRFAAVLAERSRIAREIHDTLAQGFAGTSVQLELVSKMLSSMPEQARIHLDQARMQVRESLADARRSVWELRSPALNQQDLPKALTESAKRLTANLPIEAEVRVSGAYRRLDSELENNILRICQEAVTNAVRHAEARRIGIDLSYDQKRVRLSVRDDGQGLKHNGEPAEKGHFGLVGMRERAEQAGGQLAVNDAPGGGTEVVFEKMIV
jgi:ligand-binding sensor domain-containing protein/signal transduction histidine kinase